MVMNALDEIGEVLKSVPPAEDLEQEKFERSFDVVVITGAEEKAVEETILSISEVESAEVSVVDPDKQAAPAAAPAPAPTTAPAARLKSLLLPRHRMRPLRKRAMQASLCVLILKSSIHS